MNGDWCLRFGNYYPVEIGDARFGTEKEAQFAANQAGAMWRPYQLVLAKPEPTPEEVSE